MNSPCSTCNPPPSHSSPHPSLLDSLFPSVPLPETVSYDEWVQNNPVLLVPYDFSIEIVSKREKSATFTRIPRDEYQLVLIKISDRLKEYVGHLAYFSNHKYYDGYGTFTGFSDHYLRVPVSEDISNIKAYIQTCAQNMISEFNLENIDKYYDAKIVRITPFPNQVDVLSDTPNALNELVFLTRHGYELNQNLYLIVRDWFFVKMSYIIRDENSPKWNFYYDLYKQMIEYLISLGISIPNGGD